MKLVALTINSGLLLLAMKRRPSRHSRMAGKSVWQLIEVNWSSPGTTFFFTKINSSTKPFQNVFHRKSIKLNHNLFFSDHFHLGEINYARVFNRTNLPRSSPARLPSEPRGGCHFSFSARLDFTARWDWVSVLE